MRRRLATIEPGGSLFQASTASTGPRYRACLSGGTRRSGCSTWGPGRGYLARWSLEMLRVARRRLTEGNGRFEFRNMDYARKPLPRGYDLVVSALSIHHLTHGDKKELFERIHEALAEGGYFVNADQVQGETPEEETSYREWWLRRVREAGVSEGDLDAALSRMRADRNATLRAQLGWLVEAGFGAVRCAYKDHRFAVYGGRKGRENADKGKESDG